MLLYTTPLDVAPRHQTGRHEACDHLGDRRRGETGVFGDHRTVELADAACDRDTNASLYSRR
ncbi:hypothetical protein [Streptosporangium subroseum]|uniref:hypothetical protein n=1 Tax=Streptosporangium subroseum TaxID=106412 RepID=UPI000B77BABC|nr:hypothetical protein [Streptosporangium subroseum]